MEQQSGNELRDFLDGIDLSQYYDAFIREGFERLESLAEIQEPDFEALGVKRGHRRRRALELVGEARFPRDRSSMVSPLVGSQIRPSIVESQGPSPSLEEIEPLTVYLHRPHNQHHQSVRSHQQMPLSAAAVSAAQPQPSSSQSHLLQTTSPYQRQRQHQPLQEYALQQYCSRTYPCQQQPHQSHMQSAVHTSTLARQPIPSMRTTTEEPTRVVRHHHTPSHSDRQVVANVSCPTTAPETTTAPLLPPALPSSIITQAPLQQRSQVPGMAVVGSVPSNKPSTPTSPFSGPYQQVTPISSIMRSSSIKASSSSTSGRRTSDSLTNPRSPYSRPAVIVEPPASPKPQPGSSHSPKRTYRRHPKKDPNAPEKWRSAYQLFRDDVNHELNGQEIPFSEMSKIHSKRWAELSDERRNMYFEQSKKDKDRYLQRMEQYEQTLEYRQYEEYLEEFYKQDSTVNRVGRPKGARAAKTKDKEPEDDSTFMQATMPYEQDDHQPQHPEGSS